MPNNDIKHAWQRRHGILVGYNCLHDEWCANTVSVRAFSNASEGDALAKLAEILKIPLWDEENRKPTEPDAPFCGGGD